MKPVYATNEDVSMNDQKAPTCFYCGEPIGYLSTAGVTVLLGDAEFCDDVCADQWLDEKSPQTKARIMQELSDKAQSEASEAAPVQDD